MPRTLLCTACLEAVPVETSSWAHTMTLHVLDNPQHPRILRVLDIDATFTALIQRTWGRP